MKLRLRILSVLAATWGLMAATALAQSDPAASDQASATSRAIAELSAAYQTLAGLLNQGSGEAVDRVQGDIENLGDWEYKIVEFEDESAAEIETALNALGDDRWEAYWIEHQRETTRVFLKRSAISYLSRVPLAALLRLLSGGSE